MTLLNNFKVYVRYVVHSVMRLFGASPSIPKEDNISEQNNKSRWNDFWWYFDVAGILLDPPETWLDVAINLYDLDTYLDPRSPDADAQRSLNAAETGDVDVEAPPPQKKIVRNKIWWLYRALELLFVVSTSILILMFIPQSNPILGSLYMGPKY